MNRRGFTLLEITMAAVIGALCAIAGLALFNGLLSADKTLGRRFEQEMSIERTRLVIERCFMTLVTSERNPPRSRPGNNVARPTTSDDANKPDDGQAIDTSRTEPTAQTPEPPRVILEPDADPLLRSLGANVQRLELVLSQSPVPTNNPARFRPENDQIVRHDDSSNVSAIRGCLELRPQVYQKGDRAEEDKRKILWQLWWRPLPPRASSADQPDPALTWTPPCKPLLLAGNLESLEWRIFHEGVYKTVYSATYSTELPAYAQVRLTTSDGFKADWLFEINYSRGSEVSDDESTPSDTKSHKVTLPINSTRGGTRGGPS